MASSEMSRTAAGSEVPEYKVDGPLSAVMIACGIGSFTLGLFTTWAEASTSFKSRLAFDDGVGPLSGKTIWATVAFFVSWAVLGYMMRGRDGTLRNATIVFLILLALGVLGTFPTFFEAFA